MLKISLIGLIMLLSLLGFEKKSVAQTMNIKEVHNTGGNNTINKALNILELEKTKYPHFNNDLTRILANKNDAYVSFRTSDIIYVPQNSTIITGVSVNVVTGVVHNNIISSLPTEEKKGKVLKPIAIKVKQADKIKAIEAVAKSRDQSVEELEKHIGSLFPNIGLTILDMGEYYSVSEFMTDSYEWSYNLNKKTGEKSDEFSASIEPNPRMEDGGLDDLIYKEIKSSTTERRGSLPKGIGCKKR